MRKEATRLHYDQRIFQEKRDAYIGLFYSLKECLVSRSDRALKGYGLSQARVELVGSKDVISLSRAFKNAAPGSNAQDVLFDDMLKAMKTDLRMDLVRD
ncbi:hypothetical protein [Desulfovibrio sp. Huiquan2017]|uniref:hypothetical protein n=1 Tax=Desulfovibrio sp. Huiquan2017 TaxID=2816861 RepID=UPI001A93630C|nr:hypothetical protein [Desulfovibrio sp. Huiquan2017]